MKIETLLRAYYKCLKYKYGGTIRPFESKIISIEKGIIRKFERLERQQANDFDRLIKSVNENKLSNRDRFIK